MRTRLIEILKSSLLAFLGGYLALWVLFVVVVDPLLADVLSTFGLFAVGIIISIALGFAGMKLLAVEVLNYCLGVVVVSLSLIAYFSGVGKIIYALITLDLLHLGTFFMIPLTPIIVIISLAICTGATTEAVYGDAIPKLEDLESDY